MMLDLKSIKPKLDSIKTFQYKIASIAFKDAFNGINQKIAIGFETKIPNNQREKVAIVDLYGRLTPLYHQPELTGTVKCVVFSKNGKYLATGVNGKKGGVYLWKWDKNSSKYRFDRSFWEGLSINTLKISLNDSWMAAGGDKNQVFLFRFSRYIDDGSVEVDTIADFSVDSESISKDYGISPSIEDLVFSQDEKNLAVGHHGLVNTGRLIDLSNTEYPVSLLPASDNSILSLAFDPSGQQLFTGSDDGRLRVYPIGYNNDQLIDSAMKLVRRKDKLLSDEDCKNPQITPCPTSPFESWRKK